MFGMSVVTILELVAGVLLVGFAGHLYRRRAAEGQRYGSQSAVVLLIHGAGLMEYRPSQAEIEAQAAPRQFP